MGPYTVFIVSKLCNARLFAVAYASITCSYTYFLFYSWLKKVTWDYETKTVNLSNVIAANGRHFVLNGYRCALCGLRNGLKTKCANGRCHAHGETNKPHHFHVTCARQIGFEVGHYNEDDFVGKFTNSDLFVHRK